MRSRQIARCNLAPCRIPEACRQMITRHSPETAVNTSNSTQRQCLNQSQSGQISTASAFIFQDMHLKQAPIKPMSRK